MPLEGTYGTQNGGMMTKFLEVTELRPSLLA